MTAPRPPGGRPGAAGAGGRITRLLHLGSVVVDVVLTVGTWPEQGGDVLASSTRTAAGGGLNVMAAAARQGLPAAYGGAHGTGPFADLARAALAAEGVEVLLPANREADTGIAVTVVTTGGERTFFTGSGAEAELTGHDLARVRADPGDVVYLSGYGLVRQPSQRSLLAWLAKLAAQPVVVFDPGPLAGTIPRAVAERVLRRTDWLTCNAREAAVLAELLPGTGVPPGADGVGAIVRVLAPRTRGGRVLVRLGPNGCLLAGPDAGPVHVPGFAVVAVDTTGAGDTHTGSFLAALAAGEPEVPALRRANAAAALSVTRPGPATAPGRAELARFLAAAAG